MYCGLTRLIHKHTKTTHRWLRNLPIYPCSIFTMLHHCRGSFLSCGVKGGALCAKNPTVTP